MSCNEKRDEMYGDNLISSLAIDRWRESPINIRACLD